MLKHILLADDEATFRETFSTVLHEEGYSVTAVSDGTEAIEAIEKQAYPVVLLDIQMPGMDGIKVLQEIMKLRPETRVIMITAYGSIEMAVEAITIGASDYVVKPVIFDDILTKINQHLRYRELEAENQQLKTELHDKYSLENIIGQTPIMQSVFETIRKVAQTKSSVLIVGESGTGKELAAQAIHSLGTTSKGRFVGINCSAIPETLLESELFGHKKGSFTSADKDKKGLFSVAEGGTLFLDEIGCMPLNCQVKVLRALEERKMLPVGATETIDFDVRFIAAINKNPINEIKAGRLREDLYYRLNVVGICLPPLRERKEDIPLLVDHFINKYNNQMGKNCKGVTEETMQAFVNYPWKGNIRELQNVIERAIIFSSGDIITCSDIGLVGTTGISSRLEEENLHEFIKSCEREHLSRILNKYKCDKTAAAKALGVGLSSLYRKIEQLQVNVGKPPVRQRQGKEFDINAPYEKRISEKLSAG
ncbi:sigma-54-dependent transcriptional regulator [Planctomycetota bacterium]